MAAAIVLALRCPRCGGAFRALQQEVVFWCKDCQVPFEVVGQAFVARQGATARAALPSDRPVLHLPLWAFRVQYATSWNDPGRQALARQIPPVEWVYVTGFELHNASYFGDPGMIYTEKRVHLEPTQPALVVGCSRSLEEAKAYVEPHLMTVIDRRVDVTGLEMSCTIRDVFLWGIPYFDEGGVLRDGILGLTVPAAALDEVGAIRTCLGVTR